MPYEPHIALSACKHGITHEDVALVIGNPLWVRSMPDLWNMGLGEEGRPNVVVYGGLDVHREELVVFVDRFEGVAFHSEAGLPRYETLF